MNMLLLKISRKVAYVMAQGQRQVTYGELEACQRKEHNSFGLGLKGDHIDIVGKSPIVFSNLCQLGAPASITQRLVGLQQEESEYIVKDCEAKLFITSKSQPAVAEPLIGQAIR